jgi:hypothetical protein
VRVAWVVLVASVACGHEHIDPAHNYAFVTSTQFDPLTFGADLSGADAICNQAAANAGLGGGFVAYLSRAAAAAPTRLAGARGWVRVDGEPFVDRVDELSAGQLFYPLRIDEHGDDVGDSAGPIATATTNNGNGDRDCVEWTSASDEYVAGQAALTIDGWADDGASTCGMPARLYCFGTRYDSPLTVTPTTGRRAFVTVQAFQVGSGLAGADALCANEAALAGLSGTFLALLPTSTATAASRFDASGPTWVRVDGVRLADSPLAFFAEDLAASPSVTAIGTQSDVEVLTGGQPTQPPGDGTCKDWTDATVASASGGRSNAASGAAFANGGGTCTTASIYCLER